MGLEYKLPDLGVGTPAAENVRWLVEVGDVVAVDQPVVEVETAKAMVEVPCPYGGVVTARFGEEGTELPVGSPLLTVAVGGDAPASGGADEGSGNVLVGYGTGAPPARRRRVRTAPVTPARPAGDALSNGGSPAAGRGAASSTGPLGTGRGTGVDTAAPGRAAVPERMDARGLTDGRERGNAGTLTTGPVPVISPLVRRIARENGLDLRALTGSGPDGLILRADVEHALRSPDAAPGRPEALTGLRTPEAAPAPMPTAAPAADTRVPLRGIRGAVADKLSRSRHEIPDATCWVDADATELLAARAAMNAAGGPKISLLALLARICTAALARHPELNSTVDMEAREIVRLGHVHLGFAAQTERGLVVPVVRDAHTRDAQSLSAEFARLTEAARTGTLTPGDLTGGTFTLNNYGVFGVDGSTPIINHPEAAMLGVGRIVPKPWVHQGELAVRQVVQLSLTFDHRVCDGGTAGGFLRYVADCVEQPAVLLRSL
ncbi:dihydrolipoamide acetyltransferase family protein [Streptomyces sp. NPDC059466]|uniref:dihydrolipoamide acetyltransferase family protein n=1 Tax=Streptomyces sp. NPDC059466 TaxID=3346843 RepID=UPI003685176D